MEHANKVWLATLLEEWLKLPAPPVRQDRLESVREMHLWATARLGALHLLDWIERELTLGPTIEVRPPAPGDEGDPTASG